MDHEKHEHDACMTSDKGNAIAARHAFGGGRDVLPYTPRQTSAAESMPPIPVQNSFRPYKGFVFASFALLVAYLLFFHRLADRDLWSSHEARAAMDAQSILDGEVGLPRLFDGRAELQKPPLYYWLVASFAQFRGEVDAWAVRLPSALSAVGCVLV